MADWYISSSKYSTYTAFIPSHSGYVIGDLVVPTAPAAGGKFVFRCTTAGNSTTEPSWNTANNGTSTSGTAVFTNVTGQSSFAWTAAAGDFDTLARGVSNRIAGGDNVYISSDHSESVAGNIIASNTGASSSYSLCKILSVNKAGSTPPVAADLAAGAVIASTTSLSVGGYYPSYHYGMTYSSTGSSNWTGLSSGSSDKTLFFDTCTVYLNSASTQLLATSGSSAFPAPNIVLYNSTVNFGAAGDAFSGSGGYQQWDLINVTLAGTAPTSLFLCGGTGIAATVRASDISSVTSNLVNNNGNTYGSKILFEGCKIASGATRYLTTSVTNSRDEVELINCYDGTHIISERYQPAGTLTTEFTTYLSSGATDNVGNYSHKIVTSANVDKWSNTFQGFWMDVNCNSNLGSSCTATVEITSGGSLNNDDVSLWLEYDGTSSSSLSSFVTSLPATTLTTASAITSSGASWNSGAGTNQKLQVTFTPRTAGRLRGQVRVGKASATLYYNPQVTVTSP